MDPTKTWGEVMYVKDTEAGQIGPKPNRPLVKSAPSQIGNLGCYRLDIVRRLYLVYFRINGKHLLVQNTTVLTRQF